MVIIDSLIQISAIQGQNLHRNMHISSQLVKVTCVLGMAFGFIVYDLMELPIFYSTAFSSCLLPLPLGTQ